MMTAQHSNKHAFWRQHLKSWRQTSQSQQAYCQSHDLQPNQFWYWKRKIEGSTAPARTEGLEKAVLPTIENFPAPQNESAFVPVTLSASTQSHSGVYLECPGGFRVHGITPESMAWIKDLIKVLA